MPRVSIIILTQNRPVWLKKALQSVFAQSFNDYEIIIINDGSTDSQTKNVLDTLPVSRVKILHHDTVWGITKSREQGLCAAVGEFIALLDDDDVWASKDKLLEQVSYLDGHSDVVLIGSGVQFYQAQEGGGFILGQEIFRKEKDSSIRCSMLFRNNFFTSTVMFRRAEAVAAGGFRVRGGDIAEDYDLWLRLGLLGKMYNTQKVFAYYRVSAYSAAKFISFLTKQRQLVFEHRNKYPYYVMADIILRIRTWPFFRGLLGGNRRLYK